jgi:hypothetical protein
MQDIRNTYRETVEPQPEPVEPSVKPKKAGWIFSMLKSVLLGTILTRSKVIRLLPFLIYITLLSLLYIFNANASVKTIIEVSKIKKQNEELRFEFVNTKAKLMRLTRQSELAKRLENRKIFEAKIPPRKIIVEVPGEQ